MANEFPSMFEIQSTPGIRRDGTDLASPFYSDGQWLRFQRGKPKKIGGYNLITDQITGPVRDTYVDSRLGQNTVHTFSPFGIQRLTVSNNGAGGAIYDRTPSGFVTNSNYTWQSGAMYSSTGGAYAALISASTPDLNDIASDTAGGVYAGDISDTSSFVQIEDGSGAIEVSGGCTVLQPFLFVYGSNGLIRNSNANDFSTATGWTTGGSNFSNSANVCGTKIVKGLPMRGGSASPSGLFWALDSLIRVTLADATILWRYDTVSASISVMSKASIIEYDGLYFWIGVDRFFVYNGVVQELPNQMSANWFFDNLNYAQRQKVWGIKVPRYGEIWWFYPRGMATECTDVIIYNIRENTWYDSQLSRSAGYESQIFHYPIMCGLEDARDTVYLTYTGGAAFRTGQTITGSMSGATGQIVRILDGSLNVDNVTGSLPFVSGETVTSDTGATGTLTSSAQDQILDTVWQHEIGVDKVYRQNITAIKSYFQTSNFSFKTGGPLGNIGPIDKQLRTIRIEPDFIQNGDMTLYVEGGNYANSPNVQSKPYVFDNTTEHIDLRDQRGILSLTFESNTLGGNYEMGKILGTIEPGDAHG